MKPESASEETTWMFTGRDGEPVTLEEKLAQSMEFGSAMEKLAIENNARANALEARVWEAEAANAFARDELKSLIAEYGAYKEEQRQERQKLYDRVREAEAKAALYETALRDLQMDAAYFANLVDGRNTSTGAYTAILEAKARLLNRLERKQQEPRMPRCSVCGRGVNEVALFRANAKGDPAVWACEAHLLTPPPEDVKQMTDLIASNALKASANGPVKMVCRHYPDTPCPLHNVHCMAPDCMISLKVSANGEATND